MTYFTIGSILGIIIALFIVIIPFFRTTRQMIISFSDRDEDVISFFKYIETGQSFGDNTPLENLMLVFAIYFFAILIAACFYLLSLLLWPLLVPFIIFGIMIVKNRKE